MANAPKKTRQQIIDEYGLHHFEGAKLDMLIALDYSLGMVVSAAKMAKTDRTNHSRWLKKDPDYKEKVELITESKKDFVESKIYEQIASGNTTMIIFFAKTKLRDRGYGESIEIVNNTELRDDARKMADDELFNSIANNMKTVRDILNDEGKKGS